MHSVNTPSRHVSAAASAPDSWYHASAIRHFRATRPLAGTRQADVVIIGAGFTGISAALDLATHGLQVVVLEANQVGAGASGRNGGLACSGWRHDQAWFEARVGLADARKLWALSEAAKADLLTRINQLGIDADWTPGQIFAAHTPGMMQALDNDAAHMAETYGYVMPQRLDRDQVAEALGTSVYHGGWRDPSAGHVHPLKLLFGLAEAAVTAGAVLHEGSQVLEVGQHGAKRFARTATGKIIADHVLLCGDGYLDGIHKEVEARVLPIGSFMIATEPLERDSPILPQRDSVMDTRFVVNYWRKTADHRLIFGGGEKYTPSWPGDVEAFVKANLVKIYPSLKQVRVSHAWGGALGITPTRLPYLRELEPGLLSASGYSGQGVVLAPYFGRILAACVLKRHSEYDVLARLPVPPFPGGRALRWPMLTAAMSWYALRDKLP
ncbi:gamma-glutamylputrescine oxidoreductase [Candidatus Phycosocius bacilliformis]|uniref:Gamma-glutamylputrescine oxidoreductase n=1 Tax=Candidatus Phycosocius bacilliformis TaxID=1445552 RepID=A0A2P2E6P9_9PROT|nr:FAD-binding oxidoreductase [Candidatus Phycosocius bacilliformis]GBF56719.1 gamma-glutamylputrescine oxidoreductase [Candidatus Phycosocius bacilliformis]